METLGRMIVLVGIAAIGVLLAMWPRLWAWHRSKTVHRRLARVNRLTAEEAAWLWRIARAACPERPAQVYVRPSLLEVGPGAARPDLARAVHAKLFGS